MKLLKDSALLLLYFNKVFDEIFKGISGNNIEHLGSSEKVATYTHSYSKIVKDILKQLIFNYEYSCDDRDIYAKPKNRCENCAL